MAEGVQFTLSGAAQRYRGQITGHGSLAMEVAATSLEFSLDYRSRDQVVLTLSGSQGIRLAAQDTLAFSGTLSRDLLARTWEGEFEVKLKIDQAVAASLKQEFTGKGSRTSVSFTVTF